MDTTKCQEKQIDLMKKEIQRQEETTKRMHDRVSQQQTDLDVKSHHTVNGTMDETILCIGTEIGSAEGPTQREKPPVFQRQSFDRNVRVGKQFDEREEA